MIGIDKGISLLMLANYQNNWIYPLVMNSEIIQKGLQRLEFVQVEE